jgi:E3 ubiquitin-protein ligase BRE1
MITKIFDINDIEFTSLIDKEKDKLNSSKFINTLDLYNKIKDANYEYNINDNNENNNNINKFILKILNDNKYNENYNNLNNIIENYNNFINSKEIFNFDIKEHMKNQEYIVDITNNKINEYNELLIILDKKINLFYKIHIETKNYISILNNNINFNNNILSSAYLLKNYIIDLNNNIINDNEIYDIIKKIINIKLEIDFFYILFCKNGTRNEDVNYCSICKNNKISCCAIPCGHTYCNLCIKNNKKCSYCK